MRYIGETSGSKTEQDEFHAGFPGGSDVLGLSKVGDISEINREIVIHWGG